MNICKIRTVEKEYQDCKLCDLHDNRKHYPHFGMGHPESKILIVLPEPYVNQEDIEQNHKLYDNSVIQKTHRLYKSFNSLLHHAGILKLDYYVVSSIMCPSEITKRPTKEQVLACHDRLKKTVIAFDPKILVLCGPLSYFSWFKKEADSNSYGLIFNDNEKFIFYTKNIDYFLELKESEEYSEDEINNLSLDLLNDWKKIKSLL